MTQLETDQLYYNVRIHWCKKFINRLANDEKVWQQHFREWLLKQGCELVLPAQETLEYLMVTDALGVAPQYHKLQFQYDGNALLFVLRWT